MLYVSQFCICNTCCPQLTTAPLLFFQVSRLSITAIEQELEVAVATATTTAITKATILVGATTSGGETKLKINVCEFVIACYTQHNNGRKLRSNLIGLI